MRYALLVLALLGAIVSALALRVHYSNKIEPCDINAKWDCGRVNHSEFAEVAHIPVAVFGVAGYLVMGLAAWKRWRFALMLLAFGAFCFSLHLTDIEEYALETFCVYCVISACIVSLILLMSIGWEYVHRRQAA